MPDLPDAAISGLVLFGVLAVVWAIHSAARPRRRR